jgi:NTP pyrophosphatase (non-canonical NTP hydrolase)
MTPSKEELLAAADINSHSHNASPYCAKCVLIGEIIAQHTRYEGRTTQEWCELARGKHDELQRYIALNHENFLHAEARVKELEAGKRTAQAEALVQRVVAEVDRATAKYPTWPTDPLHALAVLGEEYGELTKAMLQLTYEPHKTNHERVEDEAIQTAAMALRLAMSLRRYRYQPAHQHAQSAASERGELSPTGPCDGNGGRQ